MRYGLWTPPPGAVCRIASTGKGGGPDTAEVLLRIIARKADLASSSESWWLSTLPVPFWVITQESPCLWTYWYSPSKTSVPSREDEDSLGCGEVRPAPPQVGHDELFAPS